jgi:hypothetical protein
MAVPNTIAISGGGMWGLTAALALLKRGLDVPLGTTTPSSRSRLRGHRFRDLVRAFDEFFSERTQGAVLQRDDGHWPRAGWEVDWQGLQAQASGIEMQNRPRQRRDEVTGRDQVCSKVD